MDKSIKIVSINVFVVLVLALFMIPPSLADDKTAESQPPVKGYKIISIHKMFGVSPGLVNVNKGTTIIWINESHGLVQILFSAKQVALACKNPTNFIIDKDGFFVSNSIPEGSVASLCFVENGKYGYVVKLDSMQKESIMLKPVQLSGTIIVE